MKNSFKYYEFSEIADVYNGNSISKKEKEKNYLGLKDGTPYIATKDVGFDHQINYDNGVRIPESKWNEFRVAPEKSVLVCSEGGSAGRKIAYNTRDVHFGNKLFAIVPKDTVIAKYLYYYALSKEFKDSFFGQMAGLIGGVSLKKFKSIKVPIPPISKQKYLVSILDEAFNGIDLAVANAKQNIANSNEIFESYLNSIIFNDQQGWVEHKLSDVLISQPRNGWSPPARNHSDTGAPVLTLSSVTGFHFDKTKIKCTSAETNPDGHYWVEDGDFLITRSNTEELVGHVAIVENIKSPTIHPDLIMKMKLDQKLCLTKFVYYQFRSKKMRDLISSTAHGANPTMKKINKSDVQSFPVTIPKIEKQKEIVKVLDLLEEQTDLLKSVNEQKLLSLQELKLSLLKKAFSGDLAKEDNKPMAEAVA